MNAYSRYVTAGKWLTRSINLVCASIIPKDDSYLTRGTVDNHVTGEGVSSSHFRILTTVTADRSDPVCAVAVDRVAKYLHNPGLSLSNVQDCASFEVSEVEKRDSQHYRFERNDRGSRQEKGSARESPRGVRTLPWWR